MEVLFTIQSSNYVYTSKASIQVVIERQLVATCPPKFSSQLYQYYVTENLEPGSLIRSSYITIYESEELSVYSAGFDLELLNLDYTSAKGKFDIFPKYGEGTLIASLVLTESNFIDYELNTGKFEFNYMVGIFLT